MVALAIVTTGVLSLAALAQQVVDSMARSRRHLSSAAMADALLATRLEGPWVPTSPACLDRDVTGCVDTVDDQGRPSVAAPAFVRRWRIAGVASAPVPTWTLSVCVVPVDRRRVATVASSACVSRVVSAVGP
jgi:hypothetical protein